MIEVTKCLITSDFDGKILSFDKNAESLFGFLNSDVVGIKRFYNLLDPNFIVEFIKKFDFFLNNNEVCFKSKVLYVHKNGSCFSGLFEIIKNNDIIVFNVLKDSSISFNIENKVSFLEKVNIVFRTKFIIGSIIPYVFSIFWSLERYNTLSYSILILLFIALTFFHIAANTFNDYFDWKSGRDKINVDYILFSTGGSRAVDFKIISEKKLLFLSIFCLFVVSIIGLYLFFIRGSFVLILGFIGFFSAYFYSAPPIHLASRYGLGELMHIICLGPLIVYGCVFSLTGDASYVDFLMGLPFGLLITSCLLMNEYPDSKYDKISGKMNLAVVLGSKYIPYAFLLLVFCAFFVIACGIFKTVLSLTFLSVFLTLPYSYITIKSVFNIHLERRFVTDSCIKSLNVYFYFSLAFILSIVFNLMLKFFYPW